MYIGIIVDVGVHEVDQAKLNWSIEVTSTLNSIKPADIKYVLLAINERPRLVAKIESVTLFPQESGPRYLLKFSAFVYSDSEIQGMPPAVGGSVTYIDGAKNDVKKTLSSLLEATEAKRRPPIVPLHLSINEAVDALHRRYEVDPSKIKISLHN